MGVLQFVVGARHSDGTTSRFHAPAADYTEAREAVSAQLLSEGVTPRAVLVVIQGVT